MHNEAVEGIVESAVREGAVNSDLSKDLNLETATSVKESGTESLIVEKDTLEKQNAMLETEEVARMNADRTNSEVVQVKNPKKVINR